MFAVSLRFFVAFNSFFICFSVRNKSPFNFNENDLTVDLKVQKHVNETIDSLFKDIDLESSLSQPWISFSENLRLEDKTESEEADILMMNKTFALFSNPRNDVHDLQSKETARANIASKFRELGLQVMTQDFKLRKSGRRYNGVNIIGVKNGLNRGNIGEELLLVGAHYDTVANSPGVDDNGSGMVAMLEIIRLLRNRQLNHTVMFAAFDLEESGLLGSIAFVRDFFIPKEINGNKVHFLGAYVIDMILRFDPSINSQKLPIDVQRAIPGLSSKLRLDGHRGNFISTWSRRNVDTSLWEPLRNAWSQQENSSKFKLINFDCPLPANKPTLFQLKNYGTFTRSDHASFWYHNNANNPLTLKAVLLTDMGPWRGIERVCYHNWCDDKRQLTLENLQFLKQTVDSLFIVISKNPPKYDFKNRNRNRSPRPSLNHFFRFIDQ